MTPLGAQFAVPEGLSMLHNAKRRMPPLNSYSAALVAGGVRDTRVGTFC